MKNKNGLDTWTSACAASLRLLGFVTLTLISVPVHTASVLINPDEPFKIPRFYYQLLLRVLGFRVRVHGTAETKPPVMFVSNHTSYLDVPVLGSLIPAAFVAKSGVADWPFIGPLARMQGTVFVDRDRPGRAMDQRDYLSGHLAKGQSLIIFPEGTSTMGLSVLPFKSSLFSIAEKESANGLTIQPISIICTELDGLPMTRAWRPFYAWYGDMTFLGICGVCLRWGVSPSMLLFTRRLIAALLTAARNWPSIANSRSPVALSNA